MVCVKDVFAPLRDQEKVGEPGFWHGTVDFDGTGTNYSVIDMGMYAYITCPELSRRYRHVDKLVRSLFEHPNSDTAFNN